MINDPFEAHSSIFEIFLVRRLTLYLLKYAVFVSAKAEVITTKSLDADKSDFTCM